MPQERGKPERTALERVTSVAAGGVLALGIGLLTLALAAWLISQGTLGEEYGSWAGAVGLFLGALAGGGYAIAGVGARPLAVGLAAAGVCCLLWALAGQLWLGGFGVAPTALGGALAGGCASGFLFAARKKRRK